MLSTLLSRRPAQRIEDVLSWMRAIDAELDERDGLKWFNSLYRFVTEALADELGKPGAFRDPQFVAALDLCFANLYFDAVALGEEVPERAPPAWRPLLRARRDGRLAPIQFALAGMNAHINRDLPVALVRAHATLGGAPETGSARHADYERVNDVLAAVEDRAKSEILTGKLGMLDAAAGEVDDVIAMWNVRAARDAAWTNAEVLWSLRSAPLLRDRFLKGLDRLTGFAGRGLLKRAPRP